ncbi:MAG: hypothetical protein AAB316_16900 [Bacteroidota bacterium]
MDSQEKLHDMTKEELEKQMYHLLNQITVAGIFEVELVKKWGRDGYEKFIDDRLDKYNDLRKMYREL